ncbi:MAG: diguanylate cyclase [Clostridiales bacterium]|nr:diguanylate cyclase [Clostridiales bacterium]
MTGLLGWLAASALLVAYTLNRINVKQRMEQAVIDDLVVATNRSLELSQILHTALDGILTSMEMDGGAVHLYDSQSNHMTLLVQNGMDASLVETLQTVPLQKPYNLISRAVAEKRPIFLENIRSEESSPYLPVELARNINSAAAIPLYTGNELVATLLLNSRRKRRFSATKVQFITSVAQALGLALEKARLYHQVSSEKRTMFVLNEITKVINSSLDLQEIYENFAVKIRELIDYDRCVIVLIEEDKMNVRVFLLAATHQTTLPEGQILPLANTSVEWVLQHKRPQFENDLSVNRLFYEDDALFKEGIRSAVRIPIRVKDEIIGVFILNSRRPGNYSEQDLDILEPIVEHLALSLEKYLLFQQVSVLSLTDELTGLGNRRLLRQEMERELRRADRYDRNFSLLMADIDFFKRINDTYGHLDGDQVLKQLAEIVHDHVRDIDTCIRYGGEEFLVILPETDLDGAVAVAEKIRGTVEQAVFQIGRNKIQITVSLGIAVYPIHAVTDEALLQRADDALYHAKINGRNRIYVYNVGAVEMPTLFGDLEII